jgi:hypothetical protein
MVGLGVSADNGVFSIVSDSIGAFSMYTTKPINPDSNNITPPVNSMGENPFGEFLKVILTYYPLATKSKSIKKASHVRSFFKKIKQKLLLTEGPSSAICQCQTCGFVGCFLVCAEITSTMVGASTANLTIVEKSLTSTKISTAKIVQITAYQLILARPAVLL